MDSAQLQAALEAVRLNDFLRVYPSESVTTSSQVGDGGFATVWRGTLHKRDAGDLPVVVKVLKGALTEAALRQFLREARVALIVRGRHVCSLLGVTLRDGRPALLLPAYDASLFEIIHYENCLGMPLTLALEVLLKVARGLLEVHSHDVVHRDLKPDNILVNDTLSEVAIADFGLSASYTSTLSCSRSVPAGMQSGTLPYMAPEQLNGKLFGPVGPKTDLWALGCTLLEAITGDQPHRGCSIDQVYALLVLAKQPPEAPAELPADVAQLLQQLLQIEPARRPSTAEVVRRLEALVAAHAPAAAPAAAPSAPARSAAPAMQSELSSEMIVSVTSGADANLLQGMLEIWPIENRTLRTPLHAAAACGSVAIVEDLLKSGADKEAADKHGWTPLHVAAGCYYPTAVEVLEVLLKAGANIEASSKQGITPLHVAVRNGMAGALETLLKAGANKDAACNNGRTPLHAAAERDAAAVEAVLKAGANKEASDKDGATPLHAAARFGQVETVEALLKAGANIEAADKDGCTPLHAAAGNGRAAAVEALLKAGANKEAANKDGATPLYAAASTYLSMGTAAVEILLKAGANKEVAAKNGFTPLFVASEQGNTAIVKALLNAGATVK